MTYIIPGNVIYMLIGISRNNKLFHRRKNAIIIWHIANNNKKNKSLFKKCMKSVSYILYRYGRIQYIYKQTYNIYIYTISIYDGGNQRQQ